MLSARAFLSRVTHLYIEMEALIYLLYKEMVT